jgi:hypothetical protein
MITTAADWPAVRKPSSASRLPVQIGRVTQTEQSGTVRDHRQAARRSNRGPGRNSRLAQSVHREPGTKPAGTGALPATPPPIPHEDRYQVVNHPSLPSPPHPSSGGLLPIPWLIDHLGWQATDGWKSGRR